MTDVSNLDDLANAISSKSPAIKKYAQAQAKASQSQELDIQTALTQTAPTPPPPTGGSTELSPLCRRDYNGNVQAMVNAAPAGSWCYFEPGTYRPQSGQSVLADVSGKGLKLCALGNVLFETSGTNQTLVKDYYTGGSVNFEVSHVYGVSFNDPQGGGRGIEVFNGNHGRFQRLRFDGKFNRGCFWFSQWKDGRLASDNAWHLISDVRWRTDGKAAIMDFSNFTIDSGSIIGGPNSGIDVLSNSMGFTIQNVRWAMEGQQLLIEGGAGKVISCAFEQYNKAGINVPCIEIRESSENWPASGNLNTVDGFIIPHDWSTPGAHIKVGANCSNNKLDLIFHAQTPTIADQGSGTVKVIRS